MKQIFRKINFQAKSRVRIEQAQAIVAEYEALNITLTARQLYYQFVARDLIANSLQSYKNLCGVLADARYAGLIDWDAIEDRGRQPIKDSEWSTLGGLVESAAKAFRLPRWQGQRFYVEVWVEKDALASVLEPLTSEYHVTLMANRGYSSASAMYAAAQRFAKGCDPLGLRSELRKDPLKQGLAYGRGLLRQPVLLYIGDHDPSGEDMVRDVSARLAELQCWPRITKLALTMDQVRKYKPPPNPAKRTDSRFRRYAVEHGTQSWEVDALPPDVLQKIVRTALDETVNMSKMRKIVAREKVLVKKFQAATTKLMKEGI